MLQNQDAIDKLVSTWEDSETTVLPIVPSYRYPTERQLRDFIDQSKTLDRLGLVEWALQQSYQSPHSLVSIERLLFRNIPIEFTEPVENGISFKRVKITPSTAVLGLILITAFYDAGNRIAPNVLIRRGMLRAIKVTAAVLANQIKRYSTDSNVKE